ncbi:hypothetical protein [Ferrimicrobium acidiphilum]|uniref:hypothetical protein n=1 Tax=Ferrimicrobium acidiphilum TaxID=121039 RepID=UPI0023F20608|nr:hypothetical protein [Ferrimicrobium acidiphilum]
MATLTLAGLIATVFIFSSTAYAAGTVNITLPPGVPNFQSVCAYPSDSSAVCESTALADTNYGRSLESLSPIKLPADFDSEPVDQEVLYLVNAVRTSRGLPPTQIDPYLDQQAVAAMANGG